MTEAQRIWLEETVPASDVWSFGKAITRLTPEEEVEAWQKTVVILENLYSLADRLLLDPLILAVGDAEERAREELARAEDRLSRPETGGLHPRERERLLRLEARYEALTVDRGELSAEAQEALEGLRREAEESLWRYRAETSLPGPTE
jgi:hypothetical protein